MAINFRKTAPGIPPHGVKETMIMDEAVNLENATTNMLTYVRPQFPGVRLKGTYCGKRILSYLILFTLPSYLHCTWHTSGSTFFFFFFKFCQHIFSAVFRLIF